MPPTIKADRPLGGATCDAAIGPLALAALPAACALTRWEKPRQSSSTSARRQDMRARVVVNASLGQRGLAWPPASTPVELLNLARRERGQRVHRKVGREV